MTTTQMYTKGARVWIPHTEKVWEGARVLEDFVKSSLKVVTEDGQTREIKVATDSDLPPLRNPDILIGGNDLTSLSYLHEPAVLHNLEVRFCREKAIYTYCGIVLVAINPYSEMSIYGSDTIWTYRGRAMGELEPHIFAVAEEAYTKMEREQKDQSIIVSGESGAGKTVSAKYAMRYFATVGGSMTETHVEKKVLASSPIMEAIGNAKTIRNDNSSRFGKFIELHFTRNYTISGASMRTYLLEKSRVVYQTPKERNYHIFYQLCAARAKNPELMLQPPTSYEYLSDECDIPGADDGASYEETVNALLTLGFSQQDIKDVFTILAGILHLGNISIVAQAEEEGDDDSEICTIQGNDRFLEYVCKLYQVPSVELRHWLCHRQIVSSRETLDKPMNVAEAKGARDALVKHIYASLFSWIVGVINRALKTSADSKHKFIGVLDIYGFETFEANSFEQFCINYANEKLQQQFNQHVFKLEQEEYMKEGIQWKFIDFYDNQPCIDLIESKLGVLDLLDEECRMPKGSDSSWAEKLYSKCAKFNHFAKPRFGTSSFVIKHFADRVDYDVSGFLEKNRDTVIEEQVNVLRVSNNRLLHRLFRETNEEGKLAVPKTKVKISVQPKAVSGTKNKKTVGSQFRDSLNALMTTLNATTPHYIRCIKPNDDKSDFKYNPSRAVQQLRACGVLETIRISAAGFPSRWLYSDFMKRYRALCKSRDINRNNMKITCEQLVNNVIKDTDKYKFGETKIFFRAGQVAYLERLRSEKLLECCVRIQTAVRGFLVRRRYTRTLRATGTLQRYFRGYLARRRVEKIRKNRAATTIQRFVRGWVKRRQYLRLRKLALGLQKYSRGFLARQRYQHMRQNRAAILIQKRVRGWLCRLRYLRIRRKIIIAQSAVRRYSARKKFRLMKREARSAEHLKKLNKGLENKIISLQQKLGEISKENSHLKNAIQEITETKAKLDALRGVDVELKKVSKQLYQRDNEVVTLRDEIGELKQSVAQKDKISCTQESERKELLEQNKTLKNELTKLRDELKSVQIGQEEELKNRITQEKKVLQDECDQERSIHQKLLMEKLTLEAKVESLEKEIQIMSGAVKTHKRTPSDLSTISGQDDDIGYDSSIKSPSSGRDDTPTPDQQMDIGLVLKLQQKLKSLASENHRLHNKFQIKQGFYYSQPSQETFVIQDLEIENAKLKEDLKVLRDCISNDAANAGNSGLAVLKRQLEAREGEVSRLREENRQLRSAFSSRTQGTINLGQGPYSGYDDIEPTLINEDGELVQAYEAQKKIIRQQAEELEFKTMQWEVEREELVNELKRLREELESHKSLLSTGISGDSFLQSEISRLSSENLELQENYDRKSYNYRKVQEQLLILTRKLKESGVDTESDYSSLNPSLNVEGGPVVKKKEREYMGMFEIKYEDVNVMIKHITELKPHVAMSLLPGLPAYIIFMCVRYTDYINHEKMLQALMLIYNKSITKIIRKKVNDLELGILWLSNTVRIVHNLKQYSGEKHFGKENTQTQNDQCLKNFDLSEFRTLNNDLAVWICQAIIKTMEEKLQPLAVPAILEHEAITGLNVPIGRSASMSSASTAVVQKALNQLLDQLTSFHRLLSIHGVDHELIIQLFRQLFYFLCASSLNNLLLRKEFCHWAKGMQIRFNLSHLEQWAREQKLQDSKILEMLAPIIQASQLLQARKTDEDVDSVAEMCSDLTPNQIIKLLNLYTPDDDFEERVPASFINKIQIRLKEQRKKTEATLLMDTKFTFSIDFPFNPSSIRLEDVEIPPVLQLPMLKKI